MPFYVCDRFIANCRTVCKTICLLLAALHLNSDELFAQSYFYLENSLASANGNPLVYRTFLTVTSDGSASARVRYTDPLANEDRLMELTLLDSVLAGSDDTTYKYLVVVGDVQLIQGTDDAGFIKPAFVFVRQREDSNYYYTPAGLIYQTGNGTWDTAQTIRKEERSHESLVMDKPFVSVFFNRADEFYNYLYTEKPRTPSAVRNEKLHLVIVANTNDSKIGITSKKDRDNIVATFMDLTTDLGIPLVLNIIEGNGFSKAAVTAALQKLKPATIDIVVFYYSGHGFRYSNDTSKYPRMSLRTNPNQNIDEYNLGIENIYQQLLKKGAKVSMVLSDCCNEDIGAIAPVGTTRLKTRQSPAPRRLNLQNATALFFPQRPVAILTSAAEVNQLATGNPSMGGFFTSYFNLLLKESLYGYQSNTSWLRLLLAAKEKARWQALSAICGTGRCIQRAAISVVPPQ